MGEHPRHQAVSLLAQSMKKTDNRHPHLSTCVAASQTPGKPTPARVIPYAAQRPPLMHRLYHPCRPR
jgi:hypothetical protein